MFFFVPSSFVPKEKGHISQLQQFSSFYHGEKNKVSLQFKLISSKAKNTVAFGALHFIPRFAVCRSICSDKFSVKNLRSMNGDIFETYAAVIKSPGDRLWYQRAFSLIFEERNFVPYGEVSCEAGY